MSQQMQPIIEVSGLSRRFGSQQVLAELDLTVHRGEVFCLLGPNGAGKTTALSVLTGLVRPDGGEVRIAGIDVTQRPEEVARHISVTGQSAAVDDVLTARENLEMFARLSSLRGGAARARPAELLERFGLTAAADRRVATFSGGMRRRLDLALSLVVPTEILFLDEPTTGLDLHSRHELWAEIRQLRTAGTTIVLTTQYLEEADQLADRIGVLDGGRISALGTPEELKARVAGLRVEVCDEDEQPLAVRETDGSLSDLRRVLDALSADGIDGNVQLKRPTLDDVFLALTGSPRHQAARVPQESA